MELGKLGSVPWTTRWYPQGDEAVAGEKTQLIAKGTVQLETCTILTLFHYNPLTGSIKFKIIY